MNVEFDAQRTWKGAKKGLDNIAQSCAPTKVGPVVWVINGS